MSQPEIDFIQRHPGPDNLPAIARAIGELTEYPISRVYMGVKVKTGAYTLDPLRDRIILANGTFTITLPDAASADHVEYVIVNIGAGTVTVATVAGNINGSATIVNNTQYKSVRVASDGTNYFRTDIEF